MNKVLNCYNFVKTAILVPQNQTVNCKPNCFSLIPDFVSYCFINISRFWREHTSERKSPKPSMYVAAEDNA